MNKYDLPLDLVTYLYIIAIGFLLKIINLFLINQSIFMYL